MATLRPAAAEKEAVVGETAAATIRWIEGGIFSGRRRFVYSPCGMEKVILGAAQFCFGYKGLMQCVMLTRVVICAST